MVCVQRYEELIPGPVCAYLVFIFEKGGASAALCE